MNKLLLLIPCIVLVISSSVRAQEYFFDNGLSVGINASATHISRDKKVNYASIGTGVPSLHPFGLEAKDWAGSPSITIGYKLDDYNSLSLSGDWARYSAGGDSTTPFFGITSVDGSSTLLVQGLVDIDIDWDSDVADVELAYQRKLWSEDSGAILGVLGFKYRYEKQEFDGITTAATFRFDATKERLREHLFGPYTGLTFSFKPADSKFRITLRGSVGWLFKDAELQARNTFLVPFPPFFDSFARNDNSSQGTLFTNVGLNVVYSISKNLFVDLGYKFDWINNGAHISSALNVDIFGKGVPARVVDSVVLTHSIGVNVFYKF
jgi:hypothetical protein